MELHILIWTVVLAFVQILLVDITRTNQYGLKWNVGPRDGAMPPLNTTSERLLRAQNNLFETLPLFIAAVFVAHALGRFGPRTSLGCELYFWARVAYVPLYAFGVTYVRSAAWVASIVGLAMVVMASLG